MAWRILGARPKRLRGNLPLSPNEERYVLAETLTGQVYLAPSAMRIRGPVDMSRLEAAIQDTCDRHEARRMGFEACGDGRFSKYVEDRARVRLKTLFMPGASEETLRDVVRAHLYQKGDLSPETLHRYLLIRLGPEEHVLAYGFHHATSDGMTANSFMLEMFMRLFGYEVTDPAPQYSDFWDFDWASSEAYSQARDFWVERLAGLEAGGVLPADRSGGAADMVRPGVDLPMSEALVAASKSAAEAIGVTHFTFFYAVYLVLLSRLTGAQRVCTTFQSAGRRGKAGAEAAHGVFSNSLILGAPVDEAESIRVLAGRLRVEIREAIAHEIFPYHHVIRATGVHPRFAINWYPASPTGSVEGVSFESIDLIENQDDDDLNVRFYSYGEAMTAVAFYDPAMFGAARVRAIGEQLLALAAAFAADPDRPIGEVRSADFAPVSVLPDPAEPLSEGGPALIQDAFLAHAQATPDAVAILHGGERHSYGDLERASLGLAQTLRAAGLSHGSRVAILAERCPQLVTAMLGVARLGGIFTVLDAAHPEPHLADLVEVAAPHAILWAGDDGLAGLAERLAQPGRAATLAARAADPVADPGQESLHAVGASDPAYILFTSGSTGRPKGVACSHAPLVHFLDWQARTFNLRVDDRFTLLSGLSHDPVLRDVFAPLSLGATLVIPDEGFLEPGALAAWLRLTGANVVHLTPPLGQVLTSGQTAPLPALRRVFWGGDLLRPSTAADLARLAPQAEQVNFYGCTETPQAAGWFGLDGDMAWPAVPVGRGSDGFQLIVTDAAHRPAGVGELGEIAVRSNLLSLGYVERGRILAPADRGPDPSGRANIYFTGDRGFHLPDGSVLLVGRADDQVKVRGHRVELAQVTAAILARPKVRSALALAMGEGAHARIVAFVDGARDLDPVALKASLAARLPAHFIPSEIRKLEALPLLANGKVNRAALIAEMGRAAEPAAPASPAANAAERALIAQWGELLSARTVSRESTFANLGGDSLSYVQAYLALEEVIGEPPSGWQLMSVAELAAIRAPSSSGWAKIDAPIVIRAVAIFLVVAGHLHLFPYGGGATTALFLVSGYLFGGLQLSEVFSRGSAQPVLRWFGKLFVPTMLFSTGLFMLKALAGKDPNPSTLLLTADLQDYSKLGPPFWGGHEFYLWFIHCQLQILAIVYLCVLATIRLGGLRRGPMAFAAALFGVGCVGRFLAPALLYPGFPLVAAPAMSAVSFLPTTHLATLMLGAMIALAADRTQRSWLGLLLVVYGALSTPLYGLQEALLLVASGASLLVASHAALPKPAAITVMSLAGASLFIYLTHFLAQSALRSVHAPEWPALQVAVALAGGVAVWRGWLWAAGQLARLAHRSDDAEPQSVAI